MAGAVREPTFFGKGGMASTVIRPLDSPTVWHEGQIVALVVAETLEAAQDAAQRLIVRTEAETPCASFGCGGAEVAPVADEVEGHEDPRVGNAEEALAQAQVVLDVRYETPTQHHNPIELFSTTCIWEGSTLIIHEPSQSVYGLRAGVAEQLGMDLADIRVISRFIGGAFGSKGSVTPRTALVAIAAKRLNRPVKLVVSRAQGFTVATYRAETRHHIRLGATSDGRITAYAHESWEVTSRPDPYYVGGTETTARMYAVPNVWTRVNLVHADRNTPGFMRSPPEVPYMFALESALDELAIELKMDPMELRRLNDTMKDPISGAPYTSRSLLRCYDEAARAFGWSRRDPRPGAMRDGDWLIGWGCATACYPTQVAPAAARVRLTADRTVRVQIAAQDIGTGAYTIAAQIAADRLGVDLASVQVELGDTNLPPGPIAGGSITTASAGSAVAKACDAVIARLARGSGGAFGINDLSTAFARLGVGAIEEYAEWLPDGAKPESLAKLYAGKTTIVGGPMEDRIMYAFGAEFVEVRVHVRTREVRVPRAVGAFAAGRVINPATARSQLMGGIIWGLSSALHEATEIDRRAASYVNDDLAEYLIPVNADIGDVEVLFVPEEDSRVNPLGAKGLGELGNVGTAAAVCNAVYHATGRRIRDLPLRIEKLL
jgi:xanthine dehydrogenase YagR molybdenum-binding subunit